MTSMFSKYIKTVFASVITLFLAMTASAHCDFGFKSNDKSYCLSVTWVNGQNQIKGVFKDTNQMSPVLNVSGLRPEKWVYSKANIQIWENGDVNHVPVYLENLSLFPYMVMPGGHSHPAKSKFEFDSKNGIYILSQMALQEMHEGCWQLQLSAGEDVDLIKIMDLVSFTNLDVMGNYDQSIMCSLCESSTDTGSHNDDSHKH